MGRRLSNARWLPSVFVLLLAPCAASCSSGEHESTPTTASTDPSCTVLARVQRARQTFVLHDTQTPVIGAGLAHAFERGDALVPQFAPNIEKRKTTQVRLPWRADQPSTLRDEVSGVAIGFTLQGAKPAPVETADGIASYRNVLPNVEALLRPSPVGVEDFLQIASPADWQDLRYRIDLHDVPGVRFVSGVVEFLDARGAPRLRVKAPYLVDSRGTKATLSLQLEACDFDQDPRMPFDRPVTPPDSDHCELTLSWNPEGLSYPILIDPAWTWTEDMTFNRRRHGAARMADGRVLVAGGDPGTISGVTAEIWDPSSETWAVTGQMSEQRTGTDQSLVLLKDGRLLMATGYIISYEEVYDPTTGTWSATGPIGTTRSDGAGLLMNDGRVLVSGGFNPNFSRPAKLYDPATNNWSDAGTLTDERYLHVFVKLNDGRALVAGGYGDQTSQVQDSVEIYDPATNAWTVVSPMSTPRAAAAGAVLPDGRVLVVGGRRESFPLEIDSAEVYTPATDSWAPAPDLVHARYDHDLVLLPDSRLLVVGGLDKLTNRSVELFDVATGSEEAAPMQQNRLDAFTTTLLTDGRVLVAGGGNILYNAEVFSFEANGGTCTRDNECVSGHCVDGVCCDTICAGACSSCLASSKGTGQDGACGPVATSTDPDGECGACEACSGAGACTPVTQGTDPKNDCKDSGASCELDGVCDGAGACESYASSTNCQLRSCVSGSECLTGFCVDGVCCNNSCAGACRACTAAKKGSGSDGTCGNIAGDTDPDSECTEGANYPISCLADGMCDGAGSCRVHAKDTVSCGATQCVSGNATGLLCNGAGQCLERTTSCEPYVCRNDGCLTQCDNDNDCMATAFCSAQGACLIKLVAGSQCTSGTQCLTGVCSDGVCCDTACNGQCEACDVAPNVGACTPVAGLPHGNRDQCEDDGQGCSGQCDGVDRSACQYPSVTVACGVPSCSNGVAHSQHCNGLGACILADDKACGAFACGDTVCRTACEEQEHCAEGYGCTPEGACIPGGGLPNGSPCSEGLACQSAYCSDEVCCDSPCNGQCEACNVAPNVGSCIPVVGPPKGSRPSCEDSDVDCAGACDGVNRASCNYPGSDISCGTSECSEGIAHSSYCNAKGACVAADDRPCGAYACGETKCRTTCASPSDCAQGYSCSGQGTCVPGSTCSEDLTRSTGANGEVSCAPFLCDSGTGRCHVICSLTSECAAGYVCNPDSKACIPANQSVAAAQDEGCGCNVPGRRSSTPVGLLVAVIAVVLGRRRKALYSSSGHATR